jgi:hypothetical protein
VEGSRARRDSRPTRVTAKAQKPRHLTNGAADIILKLA